MTHSYHIHGMTCNGCRSHVEEVLSKVESVLKATVNLEKAEATIEMESPIPIEIFQEALKSDGAQFSIHTGGTHHHPEKKRVNNPKAKALVSFIVPCTAKAIKPTINLVIVLFAEWIWLKNKIFCREQQRNGPVLCTLKL